MISTETTGIDEAAQPAAAGMVARSGVTPGSALGWAAFGALAGITARSLTRPAQEPVAADSTLEESEAKPPPEATGAGPPPIRVSDLYATGA